MSLNHKFFQAEMSAALDAIHAVLQRWGLPEYVQVSLVIRDPTNDDASFVLSDEPDATEICRIILYLQEHGRPA